MRIKQISITEWYDIPGYGGKYQINYFGNIRRTLKRGYKDLHPYGWNYRCDSLQSWRDTSRKNGGFSIRECWTEKDC